MSFYSELAADAHALIVEFGTPVTLTRVTATDYDADTGVTTDPVTATWSGFGALFDYSQNEIDGSLIKQGDQRVYMSTSGITTPKSGDTLTVSGVVLDVIASRPLQPALTAVLHDVQVRGVR